MNHFEMSNWAFGEGLVEFLEKRDIPVMPFTLGSLSERAGLDGWRIINRRIFASTEEPEHLDGPGYVLDLSEPEKIELAPLTPLSARRKARRSPDRRTSFTGPECNRPGSSCV